MRSPLTDPKFGDITRIPKILGGKYFEVKEPEFSGYVTYASEGFGATCTLAEWQRMMQGAEIIRRGGV